MHPQVMKCIVEALADVLSRPHPMPVSQECLATLKTGKQKKEDSSATLSIIKCPLLLKGAVSMAQCCKQLH